MLESKSAMVREAQPSSYLGLFRAGMSTPEHRRYVTVARAPMLQDALDHLRKSMKRKLKYHFLFIGSRGSGKTHLLSLIEDEVALDQELQAHFVVARFPEESNRILSFADFLLRLCELLAALLPHEPHWKELYQKLEIETDDSRIIDTLVPAIRKENRTRKRTILIMLENVHEVFEKQMKERVDVAALRKFLMDDNGCQMVATAPIHFDEITNVDQPFFDFFDVQVLDLLSKDQAIELVRKNLEWEKRTDLLEDFETLRPKLLAIHDMTAGNPRLTLMLYELIVHDSVIEVSEQFKKLLDRVTPFYQDRLKELAPRERALLETIAVMRDDSEPKTPKRIAEKMRISEQQTSSLLKRLTSSKYIKSELNPQDRRSRLYAISEGFFDLWLAMNLSRKHRKRLPMLVECLAKFYPQREQREAKRAEYRKNWSMQNSQQGLAMLSDIGDPDEQVRSKLELALRHKDSGNPDEGVAMLEELRTLPLDSMGIWIVRNAEYEGTTINYLDEIDELLNLWSLHRSGDLEAFAERLSAIGTELNYRNYSEAKIGFLREHLALVIDPVKRIELRLQIGNLLKERSHWKDTEAEYQAALTEAKSVENQDLIADSLNNLATLLQATNRLSEAEPLMRRALTIDEQSYGTEHPKVAIRLSNLAQVLQATNMLEAESLMRRALAIDEQIVGQLSQLSSVSEFEIRSAKSAVTRDLNNLAQLLQDTNRLPEAEPLMRRALAIDEQRVEQLSKLSHVSESEIQSANSDVAIDMNNLAQLLKATNRLSEAEPLMDSAFLIFCGSLGEEHPKTQTVRNNYQRLLQAIGLTEVEALAKIQSKLKHAP